MLPYNKDFSNVVLVGLAVLLLMSFFCPATLHSQGLPRIDLPEQAPPPRIETPQTLLTASNIGPNTNLVILLDKIRNLSSQGRLAEAQKVATTALENLNESEQNEFYLRQIKAEETKLYFKLANQAMLQKQYSQASQYIARYRENVAEELENRKIRREIKTELGDSKDVSLVGRLVEELDQAKKDLAQLRAKSGLPKDDAQPDLDRLVEEEKDKLDRSLMSAENLLRKARFDSSQGRYDLADQYLNEALNSLTPNSGTIAMISDLYKAKQQVIWYRVGEAMLKGKVAEVQELTLNYRETEESRRKVETQTLGVSAEIDFDAEIRKANEKNKEQAKFAQEMLDESKELIEEREYDRAEKILLKISNFLEPSTLTWPLILEASLVKNRINLAKADDAREEKDWEKAQELLDEFRTGFYSDRNIQGDTLTYGRPGLKETQGEDAVEQELALADKELEKIRKDQRDPFKRDISEFTPEWKEQQEQLRELLMRAKVQFINGDLTGATETYRVIETRFSDNFEAKEMLKRISQMRQQKAILDILKLAKKCLKKLRENGSDQKFLTVKLRKLKKSKKVQAILSLS